MITIIIIIIIIVGPRRMLGYIVPYQLGFFFLAQGKNYLDYKDKVLNLEKYEQVSERKKILDASIRDFESKVEYLGPFEEPLPYTDW